MDDEESNSEPGGEQHEHLFGEPIWEVEWITDVPDDEHGKPFFEEATFCHRYCWTREEAMENARVVLKDDYFGSVAVTPCHLEPYEAGHPGAYIKYDGDAEYYVGETDG